MSGNRNRCSGFTIVELLAVILIIAVLIGVVSTGVSAAKDNAWRTQARDSARQLVDAWNLYLLDFRSFPTEEQLGGHGKAEGIPATVKALKPLRPEKGVKYLELTFDETYEHGKTTDESELSGVAGAAFSKKKDGKIALADHWKQPIRFQLDFNYDSFCEVPGFIPTKQEQKKTEDGKDKKGTSLLKANAAAWSMGPPSKKGKKWVAAWK